MAALHRTSGRRQTLTPRVRIHAHRVTRAAQGVGFAKRWRCPERRQRPWLPSGTHRASADLEGVCKDSVGPDISKPLDDFSLANVGKSPSGGRSGDARCAPGGCTRRQSFRDPRAAASSRNIPIRNMHGQGRLSPSDGEGLGSAPG